MNVNRLYVAQIYVCTKAELDLESFGSKYGLPYCIKKWEGKFCKPAIVYHSEDNHYIDLGTGEKYKLGFDDINDVGVGEMYINLKSGLRPLYEVFDVKFKYNNMRKKRIIKTLCKSKLLNEKEDDK